MAVSGAKAKKAWESRIFSRLSRLGRPYYAADPCHTENRELAFPYPLSVDPTTR
jgi:hypothetical protein